jgi:hypothetical protein
MVTHIRKSQLTDDLFVKTSTISDSVCVIGITPVSGLPLGPQADETENVLEKPLGPIERVEKKIEDLPPDHKIIRTPLAGKIISNIKEARWVAVMTTTQTCKDIVYYQIAPTDDEPPPLKIPQWTPQKQCSDTVRYDMTKFDWVEEVTPDQDSLPFEIMIDPRPPEQCCQEDFWWCQNLGDTPCIPEGTISAPTRFEEAECPCDCTPEPELIQYVGELTSKRYQCSINGKIGLYKQEILISKAAVTRITVSINFGDYCDDYLEFQTECELITSVLAKCLSDGLILENEDIVTIEGEGSGQFILTGEEGSVLVEINANLLRSACCRGYDVNIIVEPITESTGSNG